MQNILKNLGHRLFIVSAVYFFAVLTVFMFLALPSHLTATFNNTSDGDILQVFWKLNESNSSRASIDEAGSIEITLNLNYGLDVPDFLRLDPTTFENKAIEIEGLRLTNHLGLDVFFDVDGIYNSAVVNISDFQVKKESRKIMGLTSSNDSQIFLNDFPKLATNLVLKSLRTMAPIILIVSLLLILMHKNFLEPNSVANRTLTRLKYLARQNESLFILVWCFLISLTIIMSVSPGMMSYDTLHALRGARYGVQSSEWPPMVSYVWYVSELLIPHPSFMHFIQIFGVLSLSSLIVHSISNSLRIALANSIALVLVTIVLGTLVVIWKDVLMTVFFLATVYSGVLFQKRLIKREVFLVLATILIFLTINTRHNGVFLASFSIVYVVAVLFEKTPILNFRSLVKYCLVGFLFAGILMLGKSYIDNYSLYDGSKINNRTSVFFNNTMKLDLMGYAVCSQKNIFELEGVEYSLSEIEKNYFPQHLNLSANTLHQFHKDFNLKEAWFKAMSDRPECLLKTRIDRTAFMLGLNDGPMFLITHPNVNQNEFGYVKSQNLLQTLIFNYITSETILRPWVLYLGVIAIFFTFIRRSSQNFIRLTLVLSGSLYFVSFFIFGNAADTRLLFPLNVVSIMLVNEKLMSYFTRS